MEIIKLLVGDKLPKAELFSIGEIADLVKISRDELLLWESQFPQIKSKKHGSSARMYDQHALILFSAIKELLIEKGQPLSLAQKTLAETDAEAMKPLPKNEAGSDLLQEAYALLPIEELGFDEMTHEIYQEVKHCIDADAVVKIAPEASEKCNEENKRNRYKEYQERLAILLAQKESLNEILVGLDKYVQPSIPLDIKY